MTAWFHLADNRTTFASCVEKLRETVDGYNVMKKLWTLSFGYHMSARLGRAHASAMNGSIHITRLFFASTAMLVAQAAGAQIGSPPTSSAPVAQVPGPVTSSPSTPFGLSDRPPPPQLPTPLPSPTPSSAAPELRSIEAAPLPLPSEYRLSPRATSKTPGKTLGNTRTGDETQDGAGNGLQLPAPMSRPLEISGQNDAVLALGNVVGSPQIFRTAVAAAVDRNPALGEAEAFADEAAAARREARAGLFPTADLNATSFDTVSRAFSNDPNNIIERSRPRSRTDVQLSVNQTLFDFGATSNRIASGTSRIRAAAASIDDTASQIALRTIAAWYDIFTYRSLLAIGRVYQRNQEERRGDFTKRIDGGVNAQVDVARINSSLAGLQTRLARYERAVANAEAQFTQLTGRPAPSDLSRAPFLGKLPTTLDDARIAAIDVPAVRSAVEQAAASRTDAKASRRDNLPYVSAGIDAGRYGVLENPRDYDVRARITIRQRVGGAYDARQAQVAARANGALARSARIGEEAARDAAIAWTDLQALNRQTVSLEQSYLAARQSRDAIEVRFKFSRGTLFDVIDANDAYFGAAAAYVESLADRDTGHYVLLARTGRLLDALGINSAYLQARK
jgi:adhesin transport system outer membrane protein